MGALPGIDSVAVLPLPIDGPTHHSIAAYYTGAAAPSPDLVRQAVADALPGHFVPGTVLHVPELDHLHRLIAAPVGADTDIFSVGATSFTAVHAASAMSRVLGRAVPAAVIFRHRTPIEIATAIADGCSSLPE
ncbi:non-ribosomal peptide synthetase [Streptomyces sp. NBC_01298]|uniref:acyl carrier protein n=1 Tax=Streptomyces sp. NBC_01298 TaxID=2903817 RepID=UPI002E11397D|nr:non-ribosomal peptide synthetase [Streptomyces sp. NBC_01298]